MSSEKTKRKRKPLTIGVRLTLWGAGMTLLVCLLMSAVLYVGMYYSLLREVDGFVHGEVRELTALVKEHPGDYAAAQKAIRLELGSRPRADLSFRVFDARGRLLISSDPNDKGDQWFPLPSDFESLLAHRYYLTVHPPGKAHPIRTCSMTLPQPDGTLLIAQAGYLLDHMSQSLAYLRRNCGIALTVVVVLALVVSRFMAYRSLRSVDLMTATAMRIGTRRLTDRLPRTGNGDEIDRLAETLNNMLDRIESHVRRLQQFTADASHELRSPLAALRGNAEVALTSARSADDLRHVIEDSVEHYDRLSRIAEDLLLLARVDAGENILRPERIRLDKAVEDVVDLYAPLAADRKIELQFDRRQEIVLRADGARVRQVVGNLIDNAIKYTEGPGRIEVSLTASNGHARIGVRDTGVGIPSDELPHVFDRFYRVDRSRSLRRAPGSGLGLPICRSIIEAHGGRIDLESKYGEGTTATVVLPL